MTKRVWMCFESQKVLNRFKKKKVSFLGWQDGPVSTVLSVQTYGPEFGAGTPRGSWAWQPTPAKPALGRWRQEDPELAKSQSSRFNKKLSQEVKQRAMEETSDIDL